MNLQALLAETEANGDNRQTVEQLVTPSLSPQSAPKSVLFALVRNADDRVHDRVDPPPVRFTINAHDTTEAIASTVKSYFGLFSGDGKTTATHPVSFEDKNGSRLILSHENVSESMTVYVRSMLQTPPYMAPPAFAEGEEPYIRDGSPNGTRSAAPMMARSRSNKRHASSTPSPESDSDSKLKVEPIASAEISVENIVNGSRRKRAKFESSELPLFPEIANRITAPSSSSASPSRPTPQLTPYSQPGYHAVHPHPQSQYLYNLATDSSPLPPPGRAGLPTPAPTIASCISDEDAAIQLMRLGDAPTNGHPLPNHIRHQYSPDLDHNGRPTHSALLPSPVSHGFGQQLSPVKREYARFREDEGDLRDEDYQDDEDDVPLYMKRANFAPARQAPPPPPGIKKKNPSKPKKPKKINSVIPAPQLNAFPGYPMTLDTSFNGLEAANSLANLANPEGMYIPQGVMMPPEPQENQKPRCQRCRKSKKGCDRQRPCQRCKDAGIPADQCISEDEAGTRRGRMNAAKAAAANGIVKPKIPKPKKRKLSIEAI